MTLLSNNNINPQYIIREHVVVTSASLLRDHGPLVFPRVQLFQDLHDLGDTSGEPVGGQHESVRRGQQESVRRGQQESVRREQQESVRRGQQESFRRPQKTEGEKNKWRETGEP
jgi:hypothetical protein